jgi:hypothetical protein
VLHAIGITNHQLDADLAERQELPIDPIFTSGAEARQSQTLETALAVLHKICGELHGGRTFVGGEEGI